MCIRDRHGPNVLAPILDGGYIPLLNDNTNIYNTAMAAGKSLNDVCLLYTSWLSGCGSDKLLYHFNDDGRADVQSYCKGITDKDTEITPCEYCIFSFFNKCSIALKNA